MAIEIKQLSIRSNVVQTAPAGGRANDEPSGNVSAAVGGVRLDRKARESLLAECRAMVIEMMRRERER